MTNNERKRKAILTYEKPNWVLRWRNEGRLCEVKDVSKEWLLKAAQDWNLEIEEK